MLTRCKAHAAASFLLFLADCHVYFLTIVSNYFISQITIIARASFLLFPCAWIHFAAFVSVVSSSLLVSGCKVITFLPNKQIILQKYFLKNCKRQNKAFFVRFVVVSFAPYICPQNSVLYMYTCARVRMCVR